MTGVGGWGTEWGAVQRGAPDVCRDLLGCSQSPLTGLNAARPPEFPEKPQRGVGTSLAQSLITRSSARPPVSHGAETVVVTC